MCPKISIIVPVYNAAEFLDKCVDSILNQTYGNLELLLIDDGSTDCSGEICDKYAEKDNRVTVAHIENSGVSAARNEGLKRVKGKYVGFVDSDDWVDADMFESLIKAAEDNNADIVMGDATTVYSNGKTKVDTITQLSENTVLTKSDFSPRLLLEMAGSAWRCIYRYNANLKFPLGVKFSEDRIFNLYAFGYANKVVYLKKSYYNRFINKKSAVHRFHADYFDAVKKSAEGIEKAIKVAWNDDEKYQTAYLGQFITLAYSAINNYYYKTSTLGSDERYQAVKRLCNDEKLRSAIDKYGIFDNRSKWIMNKNYRLLILYAKLANRFYGR